MLRSLCSFLVGILKAVVVGPSTYLASYGLYPARCGGHDLKKSPSISNMDGDAEYKVSHHPLSSIIIYHHHPSSSYIIIIIYYCAQLV